MISRLKILGYLLLFFINAIIIYEHFEKNPHDKHITVELHRIDGDTAIRVVTLPYYANIHLYKDRLQYQSNEGRYINIEFNLKSYRIIK